jgi:hypothetical protein
MFPCSYVPKRKNSQAGQAESRSTALDVVNASGHKRHLGDRGDNSPVCVDEMSTDSRIGVLHGD